MHKIFLSYFHLLFTVYYIPYLTIFFLFRLNLVSLETNDLVKTALQGEFPYFILGTLILILMKSYYSGIVLAEIIQLRRLYFVINTGVREKKLDQQFYVSA